MDMHFQNLRTAGIGAEIKHAGTMDKETCSGNVVLCNTFYYNGKKFCFMCGGEVLTVKSHRQYVHWSGAVAKIFST